MSSWLTWRCVMNGMSKSPSRSMTNVLSLNMLLFCNSGLAANLAAITGAFNRRNLFCSARKSAFLERLSIIPQNTCSVCGLKKLVEGWYACVWLFGEIPCPLNRRVTLPCMAVDGTFFAIFIAVYMPAHISICIKNTPLNNTHTRIVCTWIILKQCLSGAIPRCLATVGNVMGSK